VPFVVPGLVCDGTTDNLGSINAAIATGRLSIAVPDAASPCVVSSTIVPRSGQTISGVNGRPTIRLVSGSVSRLLDLTGLSNVTIQNLTLDGSAAATGTDFIRFYNTTNSRLLSSTILSAPSTLACVLLAQASVSNEIAGNTITSCLDTSILGNNVGVSLNRIHDNSISGGGGFGIRMMSGANRNEISANTIPTSGVEPVAVSLGAQYNRIIGNHLEASGDNCISIVGDHNIISGNTLIKCAKAGVYLWGSYNTVTSNNLLDNNQAVLGWPCIGMSANYGATGQFNVVSGNTCDDDQAVPTQQGIGVNSALPTIWTAGLAVTSGQFVYYGLNNYVAASSGTTGATPPVHGSGTVTDGAVTWTYQSTSLTQIGAWFNSITGNQVIRWAGGAPYINVPPPSKPLNRNPDFLMSQIYYDSPTSTTASGLIIDGWRTSVSNSNQFVYQRTPTSLPGYAYSITASANNNFVNLTSSFFGLMTRIEGSNTGHLNWGTAAGLPVTFDVCLNTTGISGKIPFVLDNGGGAGTYYSYVMAFPVTAGSWQCFSQNIPAPPVGSAWSNASASISMRLALGLGAGSAAMTPTYGWQTGPFTGPTDMAQPVTVQGSVVRMAAVHLYQAGAVYVPRSYSEERDDAEHWFYSTFVSNTSPHSNAGIVGAICTTNPVAAGNPSVFVPFREKMYHVAAPAAVVTTYNPSVANANWRDVTSGADVVVGIDPVAAVGPSGVLLTTGATVAAQNDVLCIHVTVDSGS
jgi:parallel beta-helix repeat protein